MSSTNTGFALEGRTATPIAQLDPSLPDLLSRAVSGTVTLVWPYNSVTKTLAFTIAEPDARRRRTKGQVRVQLQGSSAQAVSALKLGGGDTVTLGLEGVEWVKDSSVPVPASRLEWQLQYAEKLVLEANVSAGQGIQRITVDHPHLVPTPPETETEARPATLDPVPSVTPAAVKAVTSISEQEPTEYASPAFIKRARLSYGALFEGGMDIFDEDGGAKGKGRKRTKFGRESNQWRYTSQSPSPTPEPQPETPSKTAEAAVEVNMEIQTSPPTAQMADEGCQTMDFEMSPVPAQQPVLQKSPNTDSKVAEPQHQQSSPPRDRPEQQPSSPSRSTTHVEADQNGGKPSTPAVKSADKQLSPLGSPAKPTDKQPSPPRAPAISTARHNTLFGNFAPTQSGYDMPRFGKPIPSPVDGNFGFADQVRFGFSHVPQTDHHQQAKPQATTSEPEPEPAQSKMSYYAPPILEPPEPSKYDEMDSYIGPAEQEMEEESRNPFAMGIAPPAVETFGDGAQWAMATEDPSYNSFEGGHYGTDALEEGIRITADEPIIRSDEIDADKVPPGFASYGVRNESEIASTPEESEDEVDQGYVLGEDFVENEELEDDRDDEVALEDNDHQEYNSEGESIEEGDYDQRPYNEPESDDEGLEDEKFMVEDEVFARDNHPDVIDEDELRNDVVDEDGDSVGSGDDDMDDDDDGDMGDDENVEGYDDGQVEEDSYDEDEERESVQASHVSGQSEGFYDHNSNWQGRGRSRIRSPTPQPTPQQAPKKPEIISLLTDSEDSEDEGPLGADFVKPEPTTAGPSHHNQRGQAAAEQDLSVREGDIDPVLLQAVASDQDAAREEAEREAEAQAIDEALEAELEEDFEQIQEEEDRDKALAEAELTENAWNQHDTGAHDEDRPANNEKVDQAGPQGSVIPSGDGAGSSPPKKAPQPDELEDTTVVTASKTDCTQLDQGVEVSTKETLPDDVEQQVSSPPRSNSVADKNETVADTVDAVAQSADMTSNEPEPSAGEVVQSSGLEAAVEDVMMEDQVDLVPTEESVVELQDTNVQPTADMEVEASSAQPEQSNGSELERDIPKSAHPGGHNAQVLPSSPPLSQSFEGRGQTSFSLDKGGKDLPTPMETQPSDIFMSQPSDIMDSLSSSSQVDVQEEAVQEPTQGQTDDTLSQADVDMGDAAVEAEEDVQSSIANQSMNEPDDEEMDDDSMDIDTQIEAQLRVEIIQTTVIQEVVEDDTQTSQERAVLVQEEENIMDAEVSYYSTPGADDSVEQQPSDAELIQEELIGQEMREIMQQDLGELMRQDLEQEETAPEESDDEDVAEEDVAEEDVAEEDVAEEDVAEEDVAEEDAVDIDGEEEADTTDQAEEEAKEEARVEEAAEEDARIDNEEAEDGPPHEAATELIVEIPAKVHVEEDIGSGDVVDEQDADQEITEDLGREISQTPETNVEVVLETTPARDVPGQEDMVDEDNAAEQAAEPVEEMRKTTPSKVEVVLESHSTRPKTRSQRAQEQQAKDQQATEPQPDTVSPQTSPETSKPSKQSIASKRSKSIKTKPKECVDSSIELARANLNKQSRSKKSPDRPESDPHWHHTRQHSPPGKCSLSPEVDAIIKQDSSVALARAALDSPSKKASHSFASYDPPKDLTKRLRTTLSDYTPLKTVRSSKNRPDHFHVLAVAVSAGGEPQRTKSREFIMTIGVIDPSVTPNHVIEVQLSAAHKAYLPIGIEPGQGVMLRKFQDMALDGKEHFGLKATEESTWAVFDDDENAPDVKPASEEEVEETVTDYMRDLRAWYADLDDVALEKVAKACANIKTAPV